MLKWVLSALMICAIPFVAPSAADAADCKCCRNLQAKVNAAKKGNNAYFRRRPYFEALKVAGDAKASQMVTSVGRLCTDDDKKTAEFKAIMAGMKGLDKEVSAYEKSLGLTLDRKSPFFEKKGKKWCCNWSNPDGSLNQKGVKGAKVSDCVCCKNLSKKVAAGTKGRTYFYQRKPYFEALKVMDEGRAGDFASSVGRLCTAKDRRSAEYKDLAKKVAELDRKAAATEKGKGLTLDRKNPFFERNGKKWCCNWKTASGEIVTK